MRDIPGIVWIIGIFFLLGGSIFIYSQTGPTPLPPVQTVWDPVEVLRQSIQYRKEIIPAGTVKEISMPPYLFTASRLPDIELNGSVSRYVVNIQSTGGIPIQKPWLAGGVDIGLVDFRPKETLGLVQLTAIRHLKDMSLK